MATKDVEMKDSAAAVQPEAEKKPEQPVDPIAVLLAGTILISVAALAATRNTLFGHFSRSGPVVFD